jgi:hypothetical protein
MKSPTIILLSKDFSSSSDMPMILKLKPPAINYSINLSPKIVSLLLIKFILSLLDSDVVDFEETFCTIDGLQILLSEYISSILQLLTQHLLVWDLQIKIFDLQLL